MTKTKLSGKSRLIKGSMLYLWEEIKTLNRAKLKAAWRMLSGYLEMKVKGSKKASRQRNLDLSPDGP